MRRFALVIGCLTAALLPIEAKAQFGPDGILGVLTSPLRGALQGLGHIGRPHRQAAPRVISRRAKPEAAATAAAATAAGATATLAKPDTDAEAASGSVKADDKTAAKAAPAGFWPAAHEDFIGYVFSPAQYDDKLWAHGFGDIINVMFVSNGGAERVRTAAVDGATAPSGGSAAKVCRDEPAGEPSSGPFAQMLRERLGAAPTEAQELALKNLDRAIGEALRTVRSACADVANAEPAARVRTLLDRLWAIRVGGYLVREPLAKFYDTLSREQKAKFERTADATDTFSICSASSAARLPFPTIERLMRPTGSQKEAFVGLQQKVEQAGLSLRASCPGRPPATPMARLDAALDRVDAITYTAGTLAPAFGDFYASLSDEQRGRLFNFR